MEIWASIAFRVKQDQITFRLIDGSSAVKNLSFIKNDETMIHSTVGESFIGRKSRSTPYRHYL